MRTGACIVQHGLTPAAAGVVNQAVTLARRRGHAQVTPLHVANVLLSSSGAGLLRSACLRSHSHPLRCKALELCFNVALNRLPSASAAAAPPLLSPPTPAAYPHRLPSLSNALVAAFKRAQANQRRGSSAAADAPTGAAQPPPPPLLAVRIEVEHLVVSILDDPSVSRVMREAGFCSTQVKTNVENALSPENGETAPPSSDLINPKTIKTKPFLKNVVEDEALLAINPAVSLGLSLNFNSDLDQEGDHSINYTCNNIPAGHNKNHSSLASTLPSWLQQHREDNKRRTRVSDEYDDRLQREALKAQHNINCSTTQMMFNFSSPSPCDSSSSSSISSSLILHHGGVKLNLPSSENPSSRASNVQLHLEKSMTASPYVNFYPNPNSTTSSSTMEMEYIPKYKELNAENLKILCGALEKKVPWQKEIIPEIAGAVLQCRSGMMKRNGDRRKPEKPNLESKEATWMLFLGSDVEGQRRISEELASLVFSSQTNIVHISSSSSPTKDHYNRGRKRPRTETSDRCSCLEALFEEISDNPHRVFLIEDLEQVDDRQFRAGIENAIERGRMRSCSGEEVGVSDAIVILSCKSMKYRSRFCRSPAERKEEEDSTTHLSLDLNLNLTAPAQDLDDDDSFDGVGNLELVDGAFLFD